MALFQGTIRSALLGMDTALYVILPYDRPAQTQQRPCKVLYLLHGLGENAAAWCRYTDIEHHARDHGFAVIMPEVQRSFYTDMKLGLPYFSYVSEELPGLCAGMFHISTRRQDTFVAGLSMGGYGALRCALTHPGRYAGAASFSGALDLNYLAAHHQSEERVPEYLAIFGPGLEIGPREDLLSLAGVVAGLPREEQPRLFMTCGEQDFLYDMNQNVRRQLGALGLDLRWESWSGAHEWSFWDHSVRLMLDHFHPLP